MLNVNKPPHHPPPYEIKYTSIEITHRIMAAHLAPAVLAELNEEIVNEVLLTDFMNHHFHGYEVEDAYDWVNMEKELAALPADAATAVKTKLQQFATADKDETPTNVLKRLVEKKQLPIRGKDFETNAQCKGRFWSRANKESQLLCVLAATHFDASTRISPAEYAVREILLRDLEAVKILNEQLAVASRISEEEIAGIQAQLAAQKEQAKANMEKAGLGDDCTDVPITYPLEYETVTHKQLLCLMQQEIIRYGNIDLLPLLLKLKTVGQRNITAIKLLMLEMQASGMLKSSGNSTVLIHIPVQLGKYKDWAAKALELFPFAEDNLPANSFLRDVVGATKLDYAAFLDYLHAYTGGGNANAETFSKLNDLVFNTWQNQIDTIHERTLQEAKRLRASDKDRRDALQATHRAEVAAVEKHPLLGKLGKDQKIKALNAAYELARAGPEAEINERILQMTNDEGSQLKSIHGPAIYAEAIQKIADEFVKTARKAFKGGPGSGAPAGRSLAFLAGLSEGSRTLSALKPRTEASKPAAVQSAAAPMSFIDSLKAATLGRQTLDSTAGETTAGKPAIKDTTTEAVPKQMVGLRHVQQQEKSPTAQKVTDFRQALRKNAKGVVISDVPLYEDEPAHIPIAIAAAQIVGLPESLYSQRKRAERSAGADGSGSGTAGGRSAAPDGSGIPYL